MDMTTLMRTCVKSGASDIHIRIGRRPVLRVHGHLRDLQADPVVASTAERLVREILPARLSDELADPSLPPLVLPP